ncbi:MAG: hypothetical protein ABSF53_16545 [Terracidiphilus sp.]|jgi:transposase
MLQYAVPPCYQRQQPIKRPKLGPRLGVIDAILNDDKQRLAKQRHTAKRIFERLKEEHGFTGSYTIVKDCRGATRPTTTKKTPTPIKTPAIRSAGLGSNARSNSPMPIANPPPISALNPKGFGVVS